MGAHWTCAPANQVLPQVGELRLAEADAIRVFRAECPVVQQLVVALARLPHLLSDVGLAR